MTEKHNSGAKENEPEPSQLHYARIVPDSDATPRIVKLIGIPFEPRQLASIDIQINGASYQLIDMMQRLGLVGETNGVPHLSVGGLGRFTEVGLSHTALSPRSERDALAELSPVDGQISRSYLIENLGLSVQGVGLVDYEQGVQVGFGVGGTVVRTHGATDIAGGVDYETAVASKKKAQALIELQMHHSGKSTFAHVLAALPLFGSHTSYDRKSSSTTTLGVSIREDGFRGVGKKKLFAAICEVLPFMIDNELYSYGMFEMDSHNAFLRKGEVVFTDYEDLLLLNRYEMFERHFANDWYMELLRKRFHLFCHINGFQPIQSHDYHNLQLQAVRVLQNMRELTQSTGHWDSRLVNLLDEDPKQLVRIAMEEAMLSKSRARAVGIKLLAEQSDSLQFPTMDGEVSADEALQIVSSSITEPLHGHQDLLQPTEESCTLFKDQDGQLWFELMIETFGLPIEPKIRIKVTNCDIFQAWKVRPHFHTYTRIKKPRKEPDPVDSNSLINTPFSLVSEMLHLLKAASHGYNMYEGFQSRTTFSQRYIDARAEPLSIVTSVAQPYLIDCQLELVCTSSEPNGPDTIITLKISDGRAIAFIEGNLSNVSFSTLNKLAYATHVFQLSAQKRFVASKELSQPIRIIVK